jgi:hypothetical protein
MLGNTNPDNVDITINRNTKRVTSTAWRVAGQWHVLLEHDNATYIGSGPTLIGAYGAAAREAGL